MSRRYDARSAWGVGGCFYRRPSSEILANHPLNRAARIAAVQRIVAALGSTDSARPRLTLETGPRLRGSA